jgi:hypothetical protein
MTASIMHLTEVVNDMIKWGIMISINSVREDFQGSSANECNFGFPRVFNLCVQQIPVCGTLHFGMRREWKLIPRGDRRAQWAGLYVTLNSKGTIVINRAAHEKLGSAEAFALLYDAANHTIGLKPTRPNKPTAFPAARSGRHGGRKISAYQLFVECGIVVKETLEFPDAEIDSDGILLLNLRNARVSNRAINHPARRTEKTVV